MMKCERLLFVFTLCCLAFAYEEKDGKIKVDLMRRRTLQDQFFETCSKTDYRIDGGLAMDRTNDSIALYRHLDNEFYGPIVIGKPGQTMNVAFDTAWSLSWVISAKCNVLQIPKCKDHNMYDNTRSSYYKPNGTKFTFSGGNSGFSGFFSYENISFAHSNVTGFLFVEMTEVPDVALSNKADGVIGLGVKDSNENYEPFFYALLRLKKIKEPVFSVYLNRDPSSNRGGNVMLGYIEERHIHKTQIDGEVIKDEIKYLPILSGTDYWQFSVDKIIVTLDSKTNTTLCEDGCTAIADTSTNEIEGPEDEIALIHDRINAREYNGRYYVNCETINGLVKVDIVLGGQYFRLNGPQYVIKMSNESSTVCLSAFVPITSSIKNTWVLGGAFLSQYYSIYNVDDRTIGFVRAA